MGRQLIQWTIIVRAGWVETKCAVVWRDRNASSKSRRVSRWSGWWFEDRRPPASSWSVARSRGTSSSGRRRAPSFSTAGCSTTSSSASLRSKWRQRRRRATPPRRQHMLNQRFTFTPSETGPCQPNNRTTKTLVRGYNVVHGLTTKTPAWMY